MSYIKTFKFISMEEQNKIFAGFGNKTEKDEYILLPGGKGHLIK